MLSTIKAVENVPRPQNIHTLQQFLVLSEWYRKFVPNYTKHSTSLTDLLKKYKVWTWGKLQKESFQFSRTILKQRPTFSHPNNKSLDILYTDASTVLIGGVLAQIHQNFEKPVAFLVESCQRMKKLQNSLPCIGGFG